MVIALTRTIISSGLKVAVVPAEYDGAMINQRVAAVQVDEETVSKEYIQAFLSTKIAVNYVRNNVNELMQPNLSIAALKSFPIPVPPQEAVREITNLILRIKTEADMFEQVYCNKLALLDELKKSLLQKAFSGQLTAKDAA